MKRLFLAICCAAALLMVPFAGTALAAPQVHTSPDVTVTAKDNSISSAQIWLTAVDDVDEALMQAVGEGEKVVGKYSLMILKGSKIKQDGFGSLKASFGGFSNYSNLKVYYLPKKGDAKSTKWLASKSVKVTIKSYKFCGSIANVIITAKSDDAGGEAKPDADGLYIGAKEMAVPVGSSLSLLANFAPVNSVAQKITWTTSDKKIATVSKKGVVKGVKAGTATIKATTTTGMVSQIKVKVTKASGGSSDVDVTYYGGNDSGWDDDAIEDFPDDIDDEEDAEEGEDEDGEEDGASSTNNSDDEDDATKAATTGDDSSKKADSALAKYAGPSASGHSSSSNGLPLPLIIGIIAAVVVLAGAGVGYFLWRKKKNGAGADPNKTQDIYIKRH